MPREDVIELRQYTLHPGRRDELIELFEREFVDPQEAAGIRLVGLFRDPARDDRFVWIRSFPDMAARRAALTAFYDGPVWQRHRDAANATMVDSDDVLLLRGTIAPGPVRGALYCAVYLAGDEAGLEAASVRRRGVIVHASLRSELAANDFPRLPVRVARAHVVLASAPDASALAMTRPAQLMELVPTARSRLQLAFRGSPRDFEYESGTWTVHHRILRERLRGCTDWIEITASARADLRLGGLVSVDEIGVGPRGTGSSFRHLELARQRWSIYWIHDSTGALWRPVHGGFDAAGDRGEFYGYDRDGGTDVLVRYMWTATRSATPRWEQAYSTDGESWETNWIMDFRR